jgi:transglutaminase-like putative cysteine protease
MTVLNIRHRTTYRYREAVQLGPHRLMLRPRESRDVRLLSSTLEMTPNASVSWTNDVFGNAVATAGFAGLADGLTIESRAVVELGASPWPVFDIAASAIHYPFLYSSEERCDLGALAVPQTFDPSGRLAGWARGFVRGTRTDTLALLKDMVAGVASGIGYQSREAEGTQTPLQTIDRGWGSCRDFAVLFAEAARSLGFGARIISGYLYNPDLAPVPEASGPEGSALGAGSTHAWTEIFLPGAGWITFDPTNRAVGGYNLIPLAVGRVIAQVMPMTGTFLGMTDAYLGMSVDVEVTP